MIQGDDRDQQILSERMEAYNTIQEVKVGEFLQYKDTFLRFSHDWGESIQTSQGGSYYLGDGYISMSGALNSGVDKSALELTPGHKNGSVWFFHHDYHTGGGGVDFQVSLRVWKLKDESTISPYKVIGKPLCPGCGSAKLNIHSIGRVHYDCPECGEKILHEHNLYA